MEEEGRAFCDSAVDFDLMNELLSGDCWLDSFSYSDILQPSTSAAPFSSSPLFSSLHEAINYGSIPSQSDAQDADFNPSSNGTPIGSSQLEPSSNWSIEPRSPIVPLKERLFHALKYIKDGRKGSEILVQIWVPTTTRRGDRDKHFLTTCGQPFWFDPNCLSLAKYRSVSTEYRFSAEANSSELLGLPGRVFIGKVPEWTPDVRYFSVEEYPRVDQAQRLNVSGTIALPVFERDSQSCIGVVEVVLTTQKINYSSDVENICNALQAVNLRSSDVLRVPREKVSDSSYQAALPEIRDVLKTVCETHGLPLAQTWITCVRQGKRGSRHSSENYKECVSTVDSACFVNDPSMFGFHEACSEHHLFRGQGVAGKAFTTNQPCFSPDITSFIKTQYPLSHHAKLFHLRAAVAIRLRSIHTGNADFVLEFFLPINCIESEEQKQMLNSLSITIRQVCRSLRVVTAKELDEEVMTEVNQSLPSILSFDELLSEGGQRQVDGNMFSGISGDVPSWIGSVMELQEKENGSMLPASVCFEFSSQERFAVSSEWDASESALPDGSIFSEFKGSQSSADQRGSFSTEPSCQRAGKATEKRRAKTEKTISLQVLRQYFAGSLKDAAKSLGVCPTTLKRICRQHGITRWPSRKIKKVGHSLKKLQVVIDSVQGAEGTFQFSSVYENFTKVSSPSKNSSGSYQTTTTKQTDQPESSNLHRHSVSNSSSSTCSLSSNSSLGGSSGSKQRPHSQQFSIKQESSIEENQAVQLVRAYSELNIPSQESPRAPIRSQSHRALIELPSQENRPQLLKRRSEDSFEKSPSQLLKRRPDVLKVKAVYGEEKVRFRLHPTWGFQELKQETLKRFNIGNICSVDLKYLDDDSEWVLLTCDADLQECIDVYKSFSCDTIKISLHHTALPVSRASFGLQQGVNLSNNKEDSKSR